MATKSMAEIWSSGSVVEQAALLLELNETLAERKVSPSVISETCRALIAPGKSSPVVKCLAFDAIRNATLQADDWLSVSKAIDLDLSKDQPSEVLLRVLEIIPQMPELHVLQMVNDSHLETRLVSIIGTANGDVQSAAAMALAAVYRCSAVLTPSFTNPERLRVVFDHWQAVVSCIHQSPPKTVHGAMAAMETIIQAYHTAVNAREAEQMQPVQTVLGYLAWSAALRVRAAGAQVISKMGSMFGSMQVDAMTTMCSIVDLLYTKDPPARLDASGALLPPDAQPSRDPSKAVVSDGWIFSALGGFCTSLLDSQDPATIAEAARTLLHLQWLHKIVKYPRMQVAPGPAHWTRSAISALHSIGDPLDSIAGREAACQTLCRYMSLLPPSDVVSAARNVVHWIVSRSSASSRVSSFLLMWRAVADVDLAGWKAPERGVHPVIAGSGDAADVVLLRQDSSAIMDVLEEPLVRALRAGEDMVTGSHVSPTLSQELVATLLEVMLTHSEVKDAMDFVLKTADRVHNTEPRALQECIDSAALLEARLRTLEWTQVAILTLHGTQGCLGWDVKREKKQGSYPSTLTVDKWFMLTSRTHHVVQALKTCQGIDSTSLRATAPAGVTAPLAPDLTATATQKLALSSHKLQGMLTKVLRYWKVLSPACLPRALFLVVSHLRLPAVQEDQWESLLDILRDLLLYQPLATSEMHTQELEMSTRTGALPYSIGAQGMKARDRPLLFGGHLLHMPEAVDWWDACAEGAAMGALVLDRLVNLAYHNFTGFCHLLGYQRIARSLFGVLQNVLERLPDATSLQGNARRLTEVMRTVLDNLPPDPQELSDEALFQTPAAKDPASHAGRHPPPPLPLTSESSGVMRTTMRDGKRLVLGPGGVPIPEDEAKKQEGTASRFRPSLPGRGQAAQARGATGPKDVPGVPRPPAGAAGAADAEPDSSRSAATKKTTPRSSNMLKAGAKGVGNVLGFRRKGATKERKGSGGGAAGPQGEATERSRGAGGAPDVQVAENARHVFSRAPRAPSSEPPSEAPFVNTARSSAPDSVPGRLSRRNSGEARSRAGGAEAPATRRAAPAPPRARHLKYIGPLLKPVQVDNALQDGYPFGAPVTITLTDAVRTKRHVVFESQITSSQQQIWEAYRDPSVRLDHSHTLADLLAMVGTLPGALQLAHAIEPSAVLNVVGPCVLAVPGCSVELTSGNEALRLFAAVNMDWALCHIVVQLKAQSMLDRDMNNISIAMRVQGPAVWVGPTVWNIASLGALEAREHTVKLSVSGSGAVRLHGAVVFKKLMNEGGAVAERIQMPTAPLIVPISLQLKSPRVLLAPDMFFQRFHTWHHTCSVSGTCKWTGAKGGMAVLDIIEKKPFQQVYLHILPAMGGFQAAYLAYDTMNRAVGMVVTAQLILSDSDPRPLTSEAEVMATSAHCLMRFVAHTASPGAAASMRDNPSYWLRELTDGTVSMALGASPGETDTRAPPLSNKYAHSAVQFFRDITPDPEEEAAAAAAAAAAAEGEDGEADGDGKGEDGKYPEKAGGMQVAAAALAALGHKQAEAAGGGAAEEDEAAPAEPEISQTGDDWLHLAVLSQWQQMRQSRA